MTIRRVVKRLLAAAHSGTRDDDLAREVASHLELLEEEFRRRGLSDAAAREAARRSLGSTALTMDRHRDARSFIWLDDLGRDVRYAIRTLRRTPGFAALAILTLALGIGATTAIFTLINDVLLRPLPVRDPRGLVVLGDTRGSGTAIGGQDGSFTLFSYDLYLRLRDARMFDALCAVQSTKSRISVRRPGAAEDDAAFARLVSTNYFEVLGTQAAAGRLLTAADAGAAAAPVAVVSFRYWRDRLHGDPSAIGSVVRVGRSALTIVGVAAPEFFGETLEPDPASFWIPLDAQRQMDPSRALIDAPEVHWLYLIGRLPAGVTRAAAGERADATLRQWLREREGPARSADAEAAIARTRIPITSGGNGISAPRREYLPALQLLLAISSVVLLIACANIANLLLARGAAREGEMAIRRAIGAGRGRLIRQSLGESLTLALAGGALGLLSASWAIQLLLALVFRGAGELPFSTSPDGRVLAFAAALSCAAAFAFGLLPAISGTATAAPRQTQRFGLANGLIVGQVVLSLVVLAAAGALARSLANLAAQELGFTRDHVLIVDVDAARAGRTLDRLGGLYRELSERLNELPGVTSASMSYYSPFNDCCWAFTIAAQGYPVPQGRRSAMLNRVSPRYFETVGSRLVRGREFDERDGPRAPRVAVVNGAFARRFLAGADPIGARFSIGDGGVAGAIEIVGLVEDAKYDAPRADVRPMAFMPLLQTASDDDDVDMTQSQFIRTIEVRTAGEPAAVAAAVRQAIASVDPNVPVLGAATLADHVDRALDGDNVVATLAGVFGAVALALTCIGLYGLTAYTVQRRTREIGIRMALGADRGTVTGMVVGEVLRRGAIGTLIGVPAAFAATGLIRSALYGIGPVDVKDSSIAALTLVASLLAAGYAPARRASRIEPIEALRHE